VRCLSVLLAHGVDVAWSSPTRTARTRPSGSTAWPNWRLRHGIPVIVPEDPNDPAIVTQLAAMKPDFLFSFYYRLMLKAPLLALPRAGAWNMHGSLLPRYRGRVPVNWAIINGERETGATLHEMVEKPDAGGIVAQQAVPILPDDTAWTCSTRSRWRRKWRSTASCPTCWPARAAARRKTLPGSYFGGRKAEDGRIDWSRPAAEVHNLIRAVAPPYPGAFATPPKAVSMCCAPCTRRAKAAPTTGPTLFVRNGHLYAECGDGGFCACSR
jgi:methionyl-tRNA formyltransferase